jgi:hypothetical protein
MKYSLQILALGQKDVVEINSETFAELKRAKDILTTFFDLTENYRVLVETYRQVERTKHEVELDHIVYSKHGYEDSADVRVLLSAPMLGYFASSRYFLDSTDKLLPSILSEHDVQAFEAMRSELYNTLPEYRFIEALRNYSQHRELPLHTVTLHNFIEDTKKHDTSDLVTSLSLIADREILCHDDKFKKTALNDMPEKINLIQCLRVHMEALWRQHSFLIEKHSATAEGARARIKEAIDLFTEITGHDTVGLHAVAKDEKEQIVDEVPLLLQWDDARRIVLRRAGNLNNLHRRYVTGKIQKA